MNNTTSSIITSTVMAASFGFMINNASDSKNHSTLTEAEHHTVLAKKTLSSSTRFNDSERFSLEQLKINKRKLQAIKNLEENWNGYNGEIIDKSVISKVETLISSLDYQPQIFPTGRGSIQLDAYLNENNLVEIEISPEINFVYQVKNGKEIEKEVSLSEINDFISELYI